MLCYIIITRRLLTSSALKLKINLNCNSPTSQSASLSSFFRLPNSLPRRPFIGELVFRPTTIVGRDEARAPLKTLAWEANFQTVTSVFFFFLFSRYRFSRCTDRQPHAHAFTRNSELTQQNERVRRRPTLCDKRDNNFV